MIHRETAPTDSSHPDTNPDTEPAPVGSPDAGPPAEGGERKRRRRRRRRGSGSSKAEGGPEGQAPADLHAEPDTDEGADEDAPAVAPAPPPAPERSPDREPRANKAHDIFDMATSFAALGLRNSVLKGVEAAGYQRPTKIQAQLIPPALAGRDVLGQAKTGSGKTAAFALPLFHLAVRALPFQAVVLVPTRELAQQVAAEMAELGKFTPIRVSAVYGGESIQSQSRDLQQGPEFIVATPGRLMDMLERGRIHLNNVRHVVLDEVDRMLDIGFREDIRRILSGIKSEHRTIFVSATIAGEIESLARKYMRDPVKIVATAGSLTVSLVEQHYLTVQPWDKRRLLLHLLTHEEPALTLVFCRTKRTVDDVEEYLRKHNVDVQAIHGDMQQGRRNRVMTKLRAGHLSVLIASDLAARGIDVDGISHVINYDLPEDPEVYIHRIGRTARAGRGGIAWSFVTPDQGDLLTAIEKLANIEIPKMDYPDFKPNPPPEGRGDRGDRDRGGRGRGGDRPPRRDERRGDSQPRGDRGSSAPPPPPAAPAPVMPARPDPSRFPGAVPARMPPKLMGGRVKTSRSGRGAGPQP